MILFYIIIITILICFLVFIIWRYLCFYYNPKRKISPDPNAILSPADGFIIYCKRIEPHQEIFSIKNNTRIKLDDLMFIDDKFILNQPGWLIGVFMTIFNIHYNRAPIKGFIHKIKHDFPTLDKINKNMIIGTKNYFFKKEPLWKDCEHLIKNERASYIIKNKNFSVYVTQIADEKINKILTLKNNQNIDQGEIFGLVRMGSQVDTFIPDKNNEFELLVKERDKVKAGITKLMKKSH